MNNAKGNYLGGAIFLAQTSSGGSSNRLLTNSNHPFHILDSVFKSNSAYFGGAIYSSNYPISISQSTFIENNAVLGGAIGTAIASNAAKIEISNSIFDSNFASLYGGSFFGLFTYAFDLSASTVTNSSQHLDHGVPSKLRIKLYKCAANESIIGKDFSQLISQGKIVNFKKYYYNQF